LDHELAVGVQFRRRTAGNPYDLPHRLAADLRHPAADVEGAHAAQNDVVLGRERRQRCERKGRGDQDTTHAVPPTCVNVFLSLSAIVTDLASDRDAAVTPRAAPPRPFA